MKNTTLNLFIRKKVLPVLLLAALFCSCSEKQLNIYDLQCENLTNPLGIDNISPHLSWKIKSDKNNTEQSAYQVIAASSTDLLSEGKADLWDSGKTGSDASFRIQYTGKPLASGELAYWKVRIWDEDGKESEWSPQAHFSIGLLENKDWTASYIGSGLDTEEDLCPLFRKSFRWDGEREKALLHVNSLGYHEIYLNGEKVSDYVLSPAVSQFNKRSLALTYDVTGHLTKGDNELVIWLSKGWYRNGLPGVVDGGPFVRARLTSLKGGSWQDEVVTDSSWSVRESGRRTTGSWRPHQFGGEVVDASNAVLSYTAAALNEFEWRNAVTAEIPEHTVSPQMTEPNSIQKTFQPVSITAFNDTTWIIDMGTNLTGLTEIKFPKLEARQKITISYCDFLDKDGNFTEHPNFNDYYIASGKENESFSNKFNYHAYRYIRLSNLRESPQPSDIKAHLVHTNYKGESSFSSSDKDLNAIHDMIRYTLGCISLGGYMVDCPHIERLGYGGDGNASTLTAQTMYDMSPLYLNWMNAWADCMREDGSMPHTAPNPYAAGGGPYWCGFIITASWQTYVNYGDDRLLKRFYPYMVKWLDYVDAHTVDGLLKRWPDTDYRAWYLGDWATPEGIDQTDEQSIGVVTNSYISDCFDTMVKIAGLLGKEADKEKYQAKSRALKELIHATYYDQEKKTYSTGTQIDLVYPLFTGVTPENLVPEVKNTLYSETENRFKGHLATGLVGVPVITQWATREREAGFMYQMLKKRDYPGYLYMIDNGATSTWEHWNGERSHIHNCYNGIGSWFYQALGGIIPDEQNPGYKHVFIRPQPVEGLDWVKANKTTPLGNLSVEWKIENNRFLLDVEIPVGCTATITLPKDDETILVGSGNHRFTCNL